MDPAPIIAAATALLNSMVPAMNTIRALGSSDDDAATRDRLEELLSKVDDCRQIIFQLRGVTETLQTENQDLREQLRELQASIDMKAEYRLVNCTGGATVYEFTEEPHHYACPRCWNANEIYPLQDANVATAIHLCPKCDTPYQINEYPDLSPAPGACI